MALSFAVVCEAPADRETGCGLADAVFRQSFRLPRAELEERRAWRGLEAKPDFLKWGEVYNLVKSKLHWLPRHYFHGHFKGKSALPDARVGRGAMLLLKHSACPPDAIFLIRDDDRKTQRREGLEQAKREAREEHGMTMPIVIGLAHPKREAWVLACFVPQSEAERERLEEIEKEIHFSPIKEPERLNEKHGGPRDPKRVLRVLTNDNPEREAVCWEQTDPEVLKTRGSETGLRDYLCQVEEKTVPLLNLGA